MKIAIAAHGTRGDVQPAFCLAHALSEAGHEVRLVGAKTFAEWKGPWQYIAAPFDLRGAVMSSQTHLQKASPLGFAKWATETEHGAGDAFFEPLMQASDGADFIISHPLISDRVAAIAEHRKIRMVPYNTMPLFRTKDFTPVLMGSPPLGLLRGLLYWLDRRLGWKAHGPMANAWRKKLGLSAATQPYLNLCEQNRWPSLEVYSSTLSPRPSDWGNERIMTGWARPSAALRQSFGEQALPEEVTRFLAAGDAPIFVSFGSMPLLSKDVLGLFLAMGKRLIVDKGWSDIDGASNDRVLYVRGVNHTLLLPQCALAVHHGGAGSTAAAASAGIPSVVCPAFVDQPFWAQQLQKLSVGVMLQYRALNKKTLESAVGKALGMKDKAARIGAQIQEEPTQLAASVQEAFNAATR